jgi:hypothetical protein
VLLEGKISFLKGASEKVKDRVSLASPWVILDMRVFRVLLTAMRMYAMQNLYTCMKRRQHVCLV